MERQLAHHSYDVAWIIMAAAATAGCIDLCGNPEAGIKCSREFRRDHEQGNLSQTVS
jgi:hypothetical protein